MTQRLRQETWDMNVLVCPSDGRHPSKKPSSSRGSRSPTDRKLLSSSTGCHHEAIVETVEPSGHTECFPMPPDLFHVSICERASRKKFGKGSPLLKYNLEGN